MGVAAEQIEIGDFEFRAARALTKNRRISSSGAELESLAARCRGVVRLVVDSMYSHLRHERRRGAMCGGVPAPGLTALLTPHLLRHAYSMPAALPPTPGRQPCTPAHSRFCPVAAVDAGLKRQQGLERGHGERDDRKVDGREARDCRRIDIPACEWWRYVTF